ncbi:MAG: DUF4886 domain-containing protein [Thermoleophilia bacterium]
MKARAGQVLVVCVVGLVCVAGLVCASCGSHPSTRVLFIGNSFTFINGGIDAQLAQLAPSCATSRIAVGGYTLEMHWNGGTAVQTIRSGHWTYVVLQEQSQLPVLNPTIFREYATEFNQAIEASGAKTVLLMTWQRPDSVSEGVTTANLAAAYRSLGAELGVKVAPAGVAFANALAERPDLVLTSLDGHPTMYGTYLAACVVYATIFGRSPVGIAYADRSISPELRDFFQRIAAESLANY